MENEKREIGFTLDGLTVPYRCQDGTEIDLFVQYGAAWSGSVTVRCDQLGQRTPKEVFGTILRALYGDEPRFENPAPKLFENEPASKDAIPVPVDEAEPPPILDASEGTVHNDD